MRIHYFFWNAGGKPLAHVLARAVRRYDIDILLLAEAGDEFVDLIEEINDGLLQKYSLPFGFGDRITFLTRLPGGSVEAVADVPYLSIRQVRPLLGHSILIAGVHLPSKLHNSDDELALLSTQLVQRIEEAEAKVGHSRTVVIGDLNMNPFENGVVGAAGFHAISSRRIAGRGHRVVNGRKRDFFYNPMWSFFGERAPGPPGTYYYSGSGQISFFWNIFDQVLLRPALLGGFAESDVQVLTEIDGVNLLSARDVPERSISDHLPILLTLDHSEELIS